MAKQGTKRMGNPNFGRKLTAPVQAAPQVQDTDVLTETPQFYQPEPAPELSPNYPFDQVIEPPKEPEVREVKQEPVYSTKQPYQRPYVKPPKYDPKKRYHFQLTKTHESAKPRDKETGEMLDNPFPHIYMIASDGVGFNPQSNEVERWRYVFGYNSIWVKDQTKPEPGKQQLENPKNFIEFKKGSLFVMGTNTALLDALHIQDVFEGVVNSINPAPPIYKLVDEDKTRKIVRDQADAAYEAEKAARESAFEDLLPIAQLFGIDVDNPWENEERIRTEVIFKAKQSPDAFSKQFVSPKTKWKYNIVQAMRRGIITDNIIPGQMVLASTGRPFFEIKEGDMADQFTYLLQNRDSGAVKLYAHIEQLLQE